MFVVEFRLASPILQEAISRVPEMELTGEELYHSDDDVTGMFWAEGDDFDAFEAAVEADPTVTDLVCLTETQSRRLYRVRYTERGQAVATSPEWSDLDISFLGASATRDGWTVRMRMPDRDTLTEFRDLCSERDLDFQLQAIYEDQNANGPADRQLTSAQREALLAAHELGYFEVPRETGLAAVAEECDVSSQAVSERIRRGIGTLVDSVVVDGDV